MFVTLLNWKVERVSLLRVVHRFNLLEVADERSLERNGKRDDIDLRVSTGKFSDDFSGYAPLTYEGTIRITTELIVKLGNECIRTTCEGGR